jgi:hypothetical protein
MWAVLLGIVLVLVAATSSHAATAHFRAGHVAPHRATAHVALAARRRAGR